MGSEPRGRQPATEAGGVHQSITQHKTMNTLSLSMMLLNQGQSFISGKFAERLALLVIDEKYPKDIFSARGAALMAEQGELWLATFDNELVSPDDKSALPMSDGRIVPKRLTITIRKTNGEIVSIS